MRILLAIAILVTIYIICFGQVLDSVKVETISNSKVIERIIERREMIENF